MTIVGWPPSCNPSGRPDAGSACRVYCGFGIRGRTQADVRIDRRAARSHNGRLDGVPSAAKRIMADTWIASDLISRLERDPWRSGRPFSGDVRECHNRLFNPGASRDEKAAALSDWLGEYQPCLFGKMEAKQGRLAFCILTENDLERTDVEIRAMIQRERRDWKRLASDGGSHGFLIAAVSPRIALARPNNAMLRLTKWLCNLYLGADEPDAIHLDDLILGRESAGGRSVAKMGRWRQLLFSAGRWSLVARPSHSRRHGVFDELGRSHGACASRNRDPEES